MQLFNISTKDDLKEIISKAKLVHYDFLVDAHCHVDSDMLDDQTRDNVIKRALEHRVKMITVPLSNGERYRALDLRERYRGWVYVVTGSHPLIDEDIRQVEKFIRENEDKIVGIGEVGLDFKPPNNEFSVMKKQVEKFEFFIELAKELDKPLVIHSRSAGRQSIDVLLRKRAERVLMHAFSGNVKYVRRGVQAGYYFSVPPTAFKNKQKINLIRAVPLEQLMLETDTPVLSPIPDEINEPINVMVSALAVTVVKEIDLEEVIKITSRNAVNFFNLN